MKEGLIHQQVILIAYGQASIVAPPGEGALDFPAFAVATQRATSLKRGLVRRGDADKSKDSALQKLQTQWIAVTSAIDNNAQGALVGRPRRPCGAAILARVDSTNVTSAGVGRGELASKRNTFAVDHHHPAPCFCPLLVLPTPKPLLAGTKLPSKKISLQSSRTPG